MKKIFISLVFSYFAWLGLAAQSSILNDEQASLYQSLVITANDTAKLLEIVKREVELRIEEEQEKILLEKRAQLEIVKKWKRLIIYQTAIFSLLTSVGIYYYRRAKMKARQRIKHQLVRDIHDDVGGVINNLKYIAKKTLERQEVPCYLEKELGKIVALGTKAQHSLRALVNKTEEKDLPFQLVAQKLEIIVLEKLTFFDIPYCWRAEGFDTDALFPYRTYHEVSMILRESLQNACKYGKKKPIEITLTYHMPILNLTVKNTINPTISERTKLIEKGVGLKNMQERANELNGKITFRTKNDFFILDLRCTIFQPFDQ